jgi:hypothetical protein
MRCGCCFGSIHLDVLRHYTPVASYYKLIKKIEADPEFDTKRGRGRSCAATSRTTTMPFA